MAAARNKIESLQALRAVAALCVVAHHAFRAVTVNADPALGLPEPRLLFNEHVVEIGAFGVDLFFILSGFLMVVIAGPYVEGRRPKADFIVQRIIRVWPLYALATLLFLALKLAAWAVRGGPIPFDFDPLRLLSLAFVPSFNENGVLQPIVGVGWTLNYEFLFYLVFLAALVAGTRHVFATLCAFLAVVFAVGLALPADTAAGAFLANPILFEFLFGGAAAVLWQRGLLPKASGWPLVALGLALLWAFAFVPNESVMRFLARGLPCLLIFAGILVLNDRIAWPRALVF
ncbi:acyltransferase [Aureimonas sp. ME7]|uniref:acyltransferase family protein n=1 Tax=Aureimonas sp. ME7 TaxID=2744252 RepID=UPI0015FB0997|nr:acyltransferase [Aureimonas sp. ME7]